MKKIFFIICMFSFMVAVSAKTVTKEATFVRCVDGDTAIFNIDEQELKFRFLAIDTPETVHPIKEKEEKGEDASSYTCDKLTSASNIIIEMEESNKTDKYGRHLGWIWVDESLLQEDLVKNGLAEVAYIYGKYRYTESLCLVQKEAINNKVGIWEKRKEGYCSQVDVSSVENNIIFNNINITNEENDNLNKVKETEEKVNKYIEENDEKIESTYIYIFIAIAFIAMIIKEIKRK